MLPLLLALGGCSTEVTRPVVPTLDQKATFTVPIVPTSTQTDVPWWQQELGPAYQQRLTQLLADNPAIRLAVAEVERQRARHDAATAETGPVLAANAGSQISRNDGTRSTRHSMGIDARLPLDLSGELSATTDARAWEYRKALAELAQARLEQVRELLLALLDHAEALQRDILLQQQIETTRKQLHLTEIRFTQGLASSVDVLQQREQIASLEQRLPAIRNDARLAANRATELLGLTPAPEPAFPRELPDIPAALPALTPMGLLQRRPDLIARQAALAAADAGFEAALRARLPSVSVSGSTFWQLLSGNPSAIVEAALDASMDLFDSGAKRAAIDEKRALLRKAGIRYLQTWLAAVRETDDLLNTLDSQDRQLQKTRQRLAIADRLYRATLSRYRRGVTDYLPVLTALRDLQQQQREALHLQAERERTLVRLKTAIGLPGHREAS